MALLVIVGGGLAWFQPWLAREEPASVERMAFPLPDKPSIAVLPFTNMSGDPEQGYFADGMTEDLITDLSKVAGLFVIARNSTFAYKGKSPDIRQVAEELGVRYVLEGSVRRSGDQVRINAQLIDATTGGHMWADRYDGNLKDIFGLQDEVTRNIVTILAVQLTTDDKERATRKETENPQAYDAFLKGWEPYLRQRPNEFRMAISYFEKAVELDPQYGRAYAALAATYWEVWKRFWHERLGLPYGSHEPRFRAEQFLAKAMQNPTPLAHQVASAMSLHMQQHEDAIAEAQRAIALDPNDADSFIALANALSLAGQADEALGWVERAMRLNPHYPPYYLYQLGLAQFSIKQLEKAASTLETATALNPDDRWSYRLLLATYGLLDRTEDATSALEVIEERDERGWLSAIDPLTVRTSAFWLPFKNPEDAERLAQGLRNAGIPD
jgi:TolB-like protein